MKKRVPAAIIPIVAILASAAFTARGAQQSPAPAENPAPPAHPAQAPEGPSPAGRERRGPQNRLFGTIASVGVDRIEVKRMDGTSQTVMVNEQTRYHEGQKELQLEDLKAGDRVFVGGQPGENKAFVATAVHRLSQEDIQRMQQMQAHRAFGQIVAINGNEIKIQNRQGERTVVVNEQTAFTKDDQPIALKDLKVGDRIFAAGDETNRQFVATRVSTGQRRGPGEWRGGPENH